MSLGIYPVFNPELKGTKFDALGEILVEELDSLEKVARMAKLTPITAFADNRPIPDDFDGDPDELSEVMGEWTEWFNPAEGQAVIQALADYIRLNSKAAKRFEEPTEVLKEMEEMVRVLGVAAEQSLQFRLEMG